MANVMLLAGLAGVAVLTIDAALRQARADAMDRVQEGLTGAGWRCERIRLVPYPRVRLVDVDQCRVCGCTDDRACPGGCWWVPDPEQLGPLCSSCRERAAS